MIARNRGYTLVEAVVVIAIAGIVAAMVASFIRAPVQAYFDSARRAQMTDTADTALRRMGRDLRTALPNSIRVSQPSPGVYYLEFLQTVGGGRYRGETDSAGAGNVLDVRSAITSFDVLGPVPAAAAGDLIVVYNLGPGTGATDAYTGGDSAAVSGVAGQTISIASKQFPFASPARRFQVVRQAVTYACNPGTGELRRYWGYTVAASQPAPPVTSNTAILAQNVTACEIRYEASPVTQRTGVVSIRLTLSQAGDTVSLFQQTHVVNAP